MSGGAAPPAAAAPHRGPITLRAVVLTLLCACLGLSLIVAVRGDLAKQFERLRERKDTFAWPPPRQTVVLSLGYRSALADLLFAHVLVESGLHLQERRRFETVAAYLRTINALDPKFATPYRYADTLITLQAGNPSLSDYRDARAILERGMHELPYDAELWLTAGQYLAYLAAPHIESLAGSEQAKAWRMEGARRLARACELGGADETLPYHCVSAASIFGREGKREALIRFVERVLSVTDDPEVHQQALLALARVTSKEQMEQIKKRGERLDQMRKSDLPFVPKDLYLLLTPPYHPESCLGSDYRDRPGCATSFAELAAESGGDP